MQGPCQGDRGGPLYIENVTENGDITCEHVVNAAGLWAKQVGRMASIELPVSPLKHHYLISDSIPQLEELDFEVRSCRFS